MLCPNCQAENAPSAEACFSCGRSFAMLTQGSVIGGRYEIRSLLGKGGMGMVYNAHDRMLDEPVAIKVLRREFLGTPAVVERFRSEIKLARKVSHPNVCRIHDYFEDGGMSFISMELLEGVDLRRRLVEKPTGLPSDEAFAAALQVARGLAAIHEVGVIHRDLKTPNVMQDAHGAIKLMDFGIAKDAASRGQTATGELMGTPEYMSPEQCRGEKLDFRSDIYALGIVIYELFTGVLPFRGESLMDTLLKQVQEPADFEGSVGARVPRSLVPVLEKALAKGRDQRFQNMAELIAALREAQRQAPAAPPAEAPAAAPSAVAEPAAPGPAASVPATASVPKTLVGERRRHSRLEIHYNVFLCRLGTDGAILHEERTVAENVSRLGARVLTSVPDLAAGDHVVLKEVGGSFSTPAVVRHASIGSDNIPRVGLEFVGHTAPDRLVMTEDERLEAAARRELPETDSTPSSERPAAVERRRHSRLAISVDVMLRRRSPGAPAEERTVTDNISRGGARVLTGMTDLKPGDTLGLKEVGGDFETEAVVRNTLIGPDRIPRLGIEFLGRAAPDRLVPSSEATPRAKRGRDTRPPGVAAEPGVEELRRQILELHGSMGTKTHYELLGVARDARESEVKKAYLALARQYHPDATRDERLSDMRREVEAIFVRLGQAYDVLRDVEKRASYERQLGAAAKAEAKPPDPPPPPAPPAETEEQRQLRLETLLNDARAHIAAGRFWEAIQLLEPAVAQTEGTRLSLPVRLLLGQATGKNPNWLKRAEELLLGVVRDAPENAEAQFQLGKLYQQAGLAQRARAALRKALELNPGHGEAKDALQALGGDERKTTRTRMRSPKKP